MIEVQMVGVVAYLKARQHRYQGTSRGYSKDCTCSRPQHNPGLTNTKLSSLAKGAGQEATRAQISGVITKCYDSWMPTHDSIRKMMLSSVEGSPFGPVFCIAVRTDVPRSKVIRTIAKHVQNGSNFRDYIICYYTPTQ